MRVSIIIPTLNEETSLMKLLPQLAASAADEILVVDGGSTDRTGEVAQGFGARVLQAKRGRGAQMNAGAWQAQGEVLWFLHADSILPPDWRQQIEGAMSDPGVVGGGFRTRIDAPGLGYRFLDLWGWVRVAMGRTLYGDQGIFVRKSAFEAAGGYPEWPVLEDLEFSARLKRQGKVELLAGPLRTSARRWKTHGFWRTVFWHTGLVLVQFGVRHRDKFYKENSVPDTVLIILAKAPIPGQVKTRLVPPLTREEAADLAKRLLQETVTLVQRLGLKVQPVVAVAPPEGIPQVQALLNGEVPLVPQPEGDFGERLSVLFERHFERGACAVLILGADHPGLPLPYLEQALELLRKEPDPVVLGPTEDGGYYLVGLKRPHPELFQGIPWSTDQVLRVTQEQAQRAGLSVRLLPPWFDVDRPEDLKRCLTVTGCFKYPTM